jgi:hypothetical protein
VKEISFEALDDNARVALEKAQSAMGESFFHYARALAFSLLQKHPLCTPLRGLIRQASVALKAPLPNPVWTTARVLAEAVMHLGGRRRTLKFLNDLERILADAPDHRWAHLLFAHTALRAGYIRAAALSLETLTVIYPELTHEKLSLAKIYLDLGKHVQAQSMVAAVLKTDPQNDVAVEISRKASVGRVLEEASA